jgi:hypothetical protein
LKKIAFSKNLFYNLCSIILAHYWQMFWFQIWQKNFCWTPVLFYTRR